MRHCEALTFLEDLVVCLSVGEYLWLAAVPLSIPDRWASTAIFIVSGWPNRAMENYLEDLLVCLSVGEYLWLAAVPLSIADRWASTAIFIVSGWPNRAMKNFFEFRGTFMIGTCEAVEFDSLWGKAEISPRRQKWSHGPRRL